MKKKNSLFARAAMLTALALVAGTGAAGCSDDDSGNPSPTPTPTAMKDIVDTAVAAGSFTTLVAAVQAADLVATLKSPGPFTVFAPTDAAFAMLPAGAVEDLLKPENKSMLAAVLTYHVASGKLPASDVVTRTTIPTVQGDAVTVSATGGTVKLDAATVTQTDIQCSNGIIHVIDRVLLPM